MPASRLEPRLTLPLSATFAGCSGCGKTQLAAYILRHQRELLREEWTRIVWLARYAQPSLEAALRGLPVRFLLVDGALPDLDKLPRSARTLIVLDDLMTQAAGSEQISRLFTAGRHLNLSVFFMTQNLFQPGQYSRTIRLNTNFLFLFRSLHDTHQVAHYFRQMSREWRSILSAHRDATRANPYGYLMLDFCPRTHDLLRFRTEFRRDRHLLYQIEQ